MSDKESLQRQANRLHKKRLHDQSGNSTYQTEPLRVVRAKQEGNLAIETTLIKTTSPWSTYEKIYKQALGENDPVLVAEKRGISGDIVDIRRFSGLSTEQIKMLQTIQHPNVVTVHEIYSDKKNHHVVFEHMPRSLQEAIGNPYLNRQRLAAIVGQVVEALVHLEKMGLQHGHLSCSQILLHPSGRVKLYGQENCHPLNSNKDVIDLGYVMMELMQGYVKEGANLGLDDPDRWDPDVVSFLSATSALSANELKKVGLASLHVKSTANLAQAPLSTVLAKGKIEGTDFVDFDVDQTRL